jgi:hypothetical protein
VHNESRIGGILSIISGAFGFLSAFGVIMMIVMFQYMSSSRYYGNFPPEMMNVMFVFYGITALCLALLGILAIIGGAYALKRKSWGLALAGSIAATITFFPCGIAAIIFIAKSQPDFRKELPSDTASNTPPPDPTP